MYVECRKKDKLSCSCDGGVCQELQAEGREETGNWGMRGLDGHQPLDLVTRLGAFCYRVGQLGILR